MSRAPQPLIGIVTLPVTVGKREQFNYNEYILSINNQFIQMSGSTAVYISYLSDTEEDNRRLYEILEQINGVYFAGGLLTLIDPVTGDTHPYYRTAKKIIDFSINLQDKHGIVFPILGICQGQYVLALHASGDQKDLLKEVSSSPNQSKVEWAWPTDQVRLQSNLFSEFDQAIIEKMESEEHTKHLHTLGITLEDFEQSAKLKDFFKIISYDTTSAGVRYPSGLEAKNYPIWCVLYHPEY